MPIVQESIKKKTLYLITRSSENIPYSCRTTHNLCFEQIIRKYQIVSILCISCACFCNTKRFYLHHCHPVLVCPGPRLLQARPSSQALPYSPLVTCHSRGPLEIPGVLGLQVVQCLRYLPRNT